MGGLFNFAFVLNEARGEYFKWCAADDYVGSTDYLSVLAASIEQGFECAFSDVDIVLSDSQQKTYLERGIMTGFNSCDNALSFSKAAVKMASHQIYGLFRKAAMTKCFSYIEASGHLRCFGEGLFVHAISEKLRLVYVPHVKYVYRRHKDNVSSTLPARILLPDFMRYTKQLYGYYICESRYPFVVKLNLLATISILHAKYSLRLFLAVIKQSILIIIKNIHATRP